MSIRQKSIVMSSYYTSHLFDHAAFLTRRVDNHLLLYWFIYFLPRDYHAHDHHLP